MARAADVWYRSPRIDDAGPAAPDGFTRLVLGVCCRGFFTGGAEYVHFIQVVDPGVVGAPGA